MKKIEFRNKEMNLLEAGLYKIGISSGIISPKLNEGEMKKYEAMKKLKTEHGEKFDEKDYLVYEIDKKIALKKGQNYMIKKSLKSFSKKRVKGVVWDNFNI